LRDYIQGDINIDGRNIGYRMYNAWQYLRVKLNLGESEREDYQEKNYEVYQLINQIFALKQSIILLRNTSYSCGSLSDSLKLLECKLHHELREKYNFVFDEEFVENWRF